MNQGESELPIRILEAHPDQADARWCLERYYAELQEAFEGGFEANRSTVSDPREFCPPGGLFLVADLHGRPVGCGAIKVIGEEVAYIKRMWIDSSLRGHGLGRRMLEALENSARALGCRTVQLETNRALTAAVHLYRTSGYVEVAPFNDEFYAHHWFEKTLPTE